MTSFTTPLRAAGVFVPALLVLLCGCTSLPPAPLTVIAPLTPGFAANPAVGFVAPAPLQTVAPEFPVELRRHGVGGLVRVDCLIDEKGIVHDPRVVETTDDALSAPALAAIIKWTFEPARREGRPVPARATIPIRFALNP